MLVTHLYRPVNPHLPKPTTLEVPLSCSRPKSRNSSALKAALVSTRALRWIVADAFAPLSGLPASAPATAPAMGSAAAKGLFRGCVVQSVAVWAFLALKGFRFLEVSGLKLWGRG